MRKKQKILSPVMAVLCLALVTGAIAVIGNFAAGKIDSARLARETAADIENAKTIYRETGRRPAGMINGEPFYDENLTVYVLELRAAVAAHYWRKFNISKMGADFWDTEFEGRTPRQFLNDRALEDLARNMVLIQQARIRGIDTPATFDDLEKERAIWNMPTDQIIFGPKTLGPAEFFSYRITHISNDLKTHLLRNEFAPTVRQLRAAFETLDEALKFRHFFASGIRFSWNENIPNQEISEAIVNHLANEIYAQEITDSLSVLYPSLVSEEFEVDSARPVSREASYFIERENILWEGYEGLIFNAPFDEPALYVVLHYEGGGTITFEEAPGLARNKWINDQFRIFLDEKVRASRITLFNDSHFTDL